MDRVRKLSRVGLKPNQSVIDVLEDALQKAKEGKITGFIMHAETCDGYCARWIDVGGVKSLLQMVGGLQYETRHLLNLFDEAQGE